MNQQALPFAVAEGTHASRLNLLGLALCWVHCDVHLANLCRWVFSVTHGGADGEALTKSLDELAARPWGLCCSRSKAKATVATGRRLGLLTATETTYTTGARRANSYAIDWPGVRRILAMAAGPEATTPQEPPASREPGQDSTRPGQDLIGPAPAGGSDNGIPSQRARTRASSLTPLSNSVPGRGPTPGPGLKDEGEENNRGGDPAAAYLGDLAELREARHRHLEPADPEPLAGSAFARLAGRHLATDHRGRLTSLPALVRWHRRQLSLREPVAGPTEAHLLLTLAAALYVAAIPAADLKRNRPAAFAGTLAPNRQPHTLRRVLPYVTEARRQLDAYLATRPEALTEPLPAAPVTA